MVRFIDVTVLFGAAGTGKSYRAANESRSEPTYYKPRGKWWDGYEQHPHVVIDDFYGWIPFDDLLRVLDQYPCRVEYKGGFKEFNSRRIWITSNQAPEDWYKGEWFGDTQRLALRRRLTRVIEYIDYNKFIDH